MRFGKGLNYDGIVQKIMHFDYAQCKQKGFAHIFALVGVLVLLAVLGEVYYLSKANSSKKIQPEVVSTDSFNQAPEENSPIASIKPKSLLQSALSNSQAPFQKQEELTYSNPNLGFELKFTKDLTVKEDSEEEYNKRGNGNYRKNFNGYVGYEPGKVLGAVVVLDKTGSYDINPFSVWVFENPNNLTPDDWFSKYWYYPFLWGVFDYTSKGHVALDQEATISGKPAKSKIVSYQVGKPNYIYISKDQKMYLFRIIGETGDKILSGFKFSK